MAGKIDNDELKNWHDNDQLPLHAIENFIMGINRSTGVCTIRFYSSMPTGTAKNHVTEACRVSLPRDLALYLASQIPAKYDELDNTSG